MAGKWVVIAGKVGLISTRGRWYQGGGPNWVCMLPACLASIQVEVCAVDLKYVIIVCLSIQTQGPRWELVTIDDILAE